MKKVHLKVGFITVFFFMSFMLFGQAITNTAQKQRAVDAFETLQNGALILRLTSKRNKIEKLEEIIAKPDITEKDKTRLRKELTYTIDERNKFNLALTKAFDKYYSFSKVYYIYDTASVSLSDGIRQGIFLNQNLELDSSIVLPDSNYLVAKVSSTNSSSTTGIQALVIMDNQLKDLERPFPYYVRINGIGRLITVIFSPKKVLRVDARSMVKALENNFSNFSVVAPRIKAELNLEKVKEDLKD